MSFREKIHWVAFIALAGAFGWYFLNYPWQIAGTPEGMWASVGMLVPVVIFILVPMIIATSYFAIRTPKEANMKEDEREKAIHQRGTHWAYYPLVVGIWVNIFATINGLTGGYAINILIATLVVAELIRVGSQLYFYRRGY